MPSSGDVTSTTNTSPLQPEAPDSAVPPTAVPTAGAISPPPSSHARALIASRRRHRAADRARRLSAGHSCICFIVDSGCTWHIHTR
eukprot:1126869-Pleurochrysis_carterae.AAC.1